MHEIAFQQAQPGSATSVWVLTVSILLSGTLFGPCFCSPIRQKNRFFTLAVAFAIKVSVAQNLFLESCEKTVGIKISESFQSDLGRDTGAYFGFDGGCEGPREDLLIERKTKADKRLKK